MQAVIPAAGEGVRMRPLTLTTPKPLLPVAGKPILQHIMEALPKVVDDVIVVVGYLGEQIVDYFGPSFHGKKITYVWQREKTGTARALQLCKPYLHPGTFLFLNADDIINTETIERALTHELCIVTTWREDWQRWGIISLNNDGTVKDFIEKPETFISNIANTNIMVLDERIFEFEPDSHATGEFYLTTMVQKLAKKYPVYTEEASKWIPIGTPEALQKAEDMIK
ncbi:MAG: nucleotidyltransferase family protein [Patescibacteria group bacterium]